MPFLVWHSLLGSSTCGPPVRCPHLSPSWSATSQKCPPITSCSPITSTTCTRPEVQRLVGLDQRHPPRGGVCFGLPGGVMDSLGAQLDQRLGRLAAHRIAGASSPDRLAVECEVAVARRRSVRVQVSVDGSLRFGPQLLAAELERREALSTTIDPPKLGRRQNRLKRRRVVPPDHPPSAGAGALHQYQVLLGAARPREVACYQHVLAVEGHVPDLRIRAAKLGRDVLKFVCLRVEDGQVRDVGRHGAVVLLDLGELAAQPDVGADLLDRSYGPVDHRGFVGLLRRQRQYSSSGKKSYHRRQ